MENASGNVLISAPCDSLSRYDETEACSTALRLSVRMEQLSSCWVDCHEIWYLKIVRQSVEKIQIWLKSDKNDGYFTWKHVYIYDSMKTRVHL